MSRQTSADSALGLQVSPNVLGFQVSTLIQNEAEMSCPHKALSSLQISEQNNNCVHCFKLLNSEISCYAVLATGISSEDRVSERSKFSLASKAAGGKIR